MDPDNATNDEANSSAPTLPQPNKPKGYMGKKPNKYTAPVPSSSKPKQPSTTSSTSTPSSSTPTGKPYAKPTYQPKQPQAPQPQSSSQSPQSLQQQSTPTDPNFTNQLIQELAATNAKCQQPINITLPMPYGDHKAMNRVYQNYLPSEYGRSFNLNLDDRLLAMDYIRSSLISIHDGEYIQTNAAEYGILNKIKVLDVNPSKYNPITLNPYADISFGMLNFNSCFSVNYNIESKTIDCSKNSIKLNTRIYSLNASELLTYTVNNEALVPKYDVFRELFYYKYVKAAILTTKQSPHFAVMCTYLLTRNNQLDYFQLKCRDMLMRQTMTKARDQEFQLFMIKHKLALLNDFQVQLSAIIENYKMTSSSSQDGQVIRPLSIYGPSDDQLPDDINPNLQAYSGSALFIITDAPTYNFYTWCSKAFINTIVYDEQLTTLGANTTYNLNQLGIQRAIHIESTDASQLSDQLTNIDNTQGWSQSGKHVTPCPSKVDIITSISRHGLYHQNVWQSILFQIIQGLYTLQKHRICIRNMTLDDNIYIRETKMDSKHETYWTYIVNNVTYYIPNYGFVVIIDSNFKDIPESDKLTCKRMYKIAFGGNNCTIYNNSLTDSEIDQGNYDNFKAIINPNAFTTKYTLNGVNRPPASVMDLITKIHSDQEQDLSRILIKYFGRYLHSAIGSLIDMENYCGVNRILRDAKAEMDYAPKLRTADFIDTTKRSFKVGDIVLEMIGHEEYRWSVISRIINNILIDIITKDACDCLDFIEKRVRIDVLRYYPSDVFIRQNINSASYVHGTPLETYRI
ncbi:Hypothetical protein MVR_LOCUS220 [uncultured virus]|nr:Hypothetical protein MVR_LOCUS220 [uncultured virus]